MSLTVSVAGARGLLPDSRLAGSLSTRRLFVTVRVKDQKLKTHAVAADGPATHDPVR